MSTDRSPIACLKRTDGYKLDHRRQYLLAGDVRRVYSNWTNRRSRMPGVDQVVHFGLQAYLQQALMDGFEPFFAAPENEVCQLYFEFVEKHLGTERARDIGTDHIRALHQLGYVPLRFCAMPEGTLVPIGVPSFTVENTVDEFFWLTNYIESDLSFNYWQPSTVATIAHEFRKVLDAAAERTGADPAAVDFQCHDFSYRGMSGPAAAAHLLSFKGTDTEACDDWVEHNYGGPFESKTVPATEHSVMSAGTAVVGELETYRRLLKLYPTGNMAIVSDTYNLWRVITEYLPALKDDIMARDGKLIIRPDSGDPEKIECGDLDAERDSPAYHGVVSLLWGIFGGTTNAKGFRELDSHIGTVYGDSISLDRAADITDHLARMGYVSTDVTLGVGSFMYQYQTRDTFGSAMKATWAEIDGKGVDLFKDPITDDGTKRSARGRLAVLPNGTDLMLAQQATPDQEADSLLQPVWENGAFFKRQTFADVRKVLAGQ